MLAITLEGKDEKKLFPEVLASGNLPTAVEGKQKL